MNKWLRTPTHRGWWITSQYYFRMDEFNGNTLKREFYLLYLNKSNLIDITRNEVLNYSELVDNLLKNKAVAWKPYTIDQHHSFRTDKSRRWQNQPAMNKKHTREYWHTWDKSEGSTRLRASLACMKKGLGEDKPITTVSYAKGVLKDITEWENEGYIKTYSNRKQFRESGDTIEWTRMCDHLKQIAGKHPGWLWSLRNSPVSYIKRAIDKMLNHRFRRG